MIRVYAFTANNVFIISPSDKQTFLCFDMSIKFSIEKNNAYTYMSDFDLNIVNIMIKFWYQLKSN